MKIKQLITLMTIFFVTPYVKGKLDALELEEISSKLSLARCISELCEKFFPSKTTTINFSFTFYANHSSTISLSQMILSNIMTSTRWTTLVDNINSNRDNSLLYLTRSGYIIQMKKYSDLTTAVERTIAMDRFAKFLVIFEELAHSVDTVAEDIIEILAQEKVISAIVVLPDPKDPTNFKVYPWSPPCSLDRELEMRECSFGAIQETQPLPPKTNQTKKCVIRANYVNFAPYVVDPKTNEGIDVKLLNTVASALDLDIVYQEAINKTWASFKNHSVQGDFVLLQNGSIDLVIGGYSMAMPNRLKYFASSPVYMTEKLTWCAPHEVLVENLANVINVFDEGTWAGVVLFYFGIACGAWYYSQRTTQEPIYQSFTNCLLYNFGILLGVPTSVLPRTGKVRYLVALFTILSFIMNLIYSSYLTSVLSSPDHREKYRTIKDISESSLRVYALNHSFKFFKNPVNDVYVMKAIEKLEACSSPIECLELVSDRGDSAVCLSHTHKNYLFKYKFPKKLAVYCLKEDYLTFSIILIMRKGFPFMEPMNNVIRRVITSGFVAKWRDDLTFDKHYRHVGNGFKNGIVTLWHLKPILKMLCWCYGLALVAFILEIVVYNIKKN